MTATNTQNNKKLEGYSQCTYCGKKNSFFSYSGATSSIDVLFTDHDCYYVTGSNTNNFNLDKAKKIKDEIMKQTQNWKNKRNKRLPKWQKKKY